MPGTLPRLLGLSDDADANRIEVFKKVRGLADKLGDEFTRTVLRLHPRLAPIKVAVFPLKKNEPRLVEMARAIQRELQAEGVRTVYDDTGAIGKLYRRQDEIGTPFCITVDFQSLEDGTVTVRDRDTMGQERAARGELPEPAQEGGLTASDCRLGEGVVTGRVTRRLTSPRKGRSSSDISAQMSPLGDKAVNNPAMPSLIKRIRRPSLKTKLKKALEAR